jgi:hypothetical protein
MAENRFDQASRHLGRQAEAKLWPWLLGLTEAQVKWNRLLRTHFTLPGFPERVGDLVASLTDLEGGGQPWAVCAEFQSEPDFDMPDRLLVTLGLLRLTEKPSGEPGDRYWTGAVVVNLTGKGQAVRDHDWSGADLRLLIKPREWNFEEEEAAVVLRQVEEGTAPVEALAWVPLMKGGDQAGIIKRWLVLVRRETDPERRADLGLALVFAELAGRQKAWKVIEGWDMKESQVVKRWEDKAEARGQALMLLHLLQKRFKKVPDDLRASVLAIQDADRLTALADVAFAARTLRRFRQEADI